MIKSLFICLNNFTMKLEIDHAMHWRSFINYALLYDLVGRHFLTGNYIARFEAAAGGGEGGHFICTVRAQLCSHLRNINIVMGR